MLLFPKEKKQRIESSKGEETYLPVEKHIGEGVSGVFEPKFEEVFSKRLILYMVANNLLGWVLIQTLPYGWYKYVNTLERAFTSKGDNEIGYFEFFDLEFANSPIKSSFFTSKIQKKLPHSFSLIPWKKCFTNIDLNGNRFPVGLTKLFALHLTEFFCRFG